MNKKISTLSAVFLMAGAWLVNVNADNGNVNPEASITSGKIYYVASGNTTSSSVILGLKNATDPKNVEVDNKTLTNGSIDMEDGTGLGAEQQWIVEEVQSGGQFSYALKNVKTGSYLAFTIQGSGDALETVKANATAEKAAITYSFPSDAKYSAAAILSVIGKSANAGKELAITANTTTIGGSGTALAFYPVPAQGITAKTLNDNLGTAFELSFKKKADLKEDLAVEANPFTSNKIKAVSLDKATIAENATSYVFRVSGSFEGFTASATPAEINAFRASEFIVVDTISYSTLNAASLTESYKYKVVKGSEMVTADGKIYASSNAHGLTGATDADLAVTRLLDNAVFAVSADVNAPKVLKIASVDAKVSTGVFGDGTAHILAHHTDAIDAADAFVTVFTFEGKYYVGTGTGNDTFIALGGSNIYDVKNLLGQYLNFSYADTRANAVKANEVYKYGGVLAITNEDGTDPNDDAADYVPASTVLLSSPEAQWAVVDANLSDNSFTLQNRENGTQIDNVILRKVSGDKFIVTSDDSNFNDDLVSLNKTAAKGQINFDGYMQTTANVLRNENFHLGQYHAIEGNNNAYFVENHTDKASHQIGMTAEKAKAQKWNLRFAMKEDAEGAYTQVDTVFVYTTFATLKDGKIVTSGDDALKDTLAILPYTFQNASNREFVEYNDNKGYEFYFCNPYNKDNNQAENKEAARFALKVKPNDTYNFVRINPAVTSGSPAPTKLDDNKVFVANSAYKGSLKNMLTYAEDQNSLMVVEKADSPEYHKIAAAWGDTIKLFRDENNSQVLYEKLDAKSVVENDSLSFLNIDNVNQFKVNPAIFADTAYINRVDANGELNTCYQYLLAVNVNPDKSYYCPYNTEHNSDEWRKANGGPCADAKEHRAVYGRFLINLIDTANVYGVDHIHNNPYINEVEAGQDYKAKLSFVEGYHADDTLYVTRKGGEAVKIAMDSPEFNVAKFAFRYVDNAEKTFKIQTQYKDYAPGYAEYVEENKSNDGYLKWINGTVVVTEGFENGDVFGIEENYAGNPTANENVTTVSGISVAATNGAVIIKGAEGKKVSIVNVLGQSIANTVITSSEATIAAPAGVVVVAVEGEAAVKAIVK